jgi:hypothetical protein
VNASVSDNPNRPADTATGSTGSASAGGSSTGGTSGTSSSGGQTDSSIVDAERVQVTLQHPTKSGIKAILDYEELHPGTVDKKALHELNETYGKLLGSEPPERSTDPVKTDPALERPVDAPDAKPVLERAPTAVEVIGAAQDKAREQAVATFGTAAASQDAANAVANNLSTKTSQELTGIAANPSLAAQLAGIGGELRGFLSGQLNVPDAEGMQLKVANNQGIQQQTGINGPSGGIA